MQGDEARGGGGGERGQGEGGENKRRDGLVLGLWAVGCWLGLWAVG